jgi:hypothetical protein
MAFRAQKRALSLEQELLLILSSLQAEFWMPVCSGVKQKNNDAQHQHGALERRSIDRNAKHQFKSLYHAVHFFFIPVTCSKCIPIPSYTCVSVQIIRSLALFFPSTGQLQLP